MKSTLELWSWKKQALTQKGVAGSTKLKGLTHAQAEVNNEPTEKQCGLHNEQLSLDSEQSWILN